VRALCAATGRVGAIGRVALLGLIPALWVACYEAAPPPADDRPNVLLVFTDQERDSSLHLPPLERPNLERLAARGVRFARAYTTFPVCSPSRSTLLTGLYPHQTGVLENVDRAKRGPPLDPKLPNLATVLGAAGYRTAYFGKWHLSRVESVGAYGFDETVVPSVNIGQESDARTAASAARWISDQADRGPWLAVVSIINPHDIHLPERYSEAQLASYAVELPPNLEDPGLDGADRAGELRSLASGQRRRRATTSGQWIEYLRFYAFLIERTDRHLGEVLDALEQSGQLERTAVIYTSDHGEMAGSHGLRAKRVLYEEAVRVPLIVSYPERLPTGLVRDELASTVDVVPTIAALAEVEWPRSLPGQSLLDPPGDEPRAVFSESNLTSARLPSGLDELATMVRTSRFKYVRYPSGAEELFDESDDPGELRDLSRSEPHRSTLDELRARLDSWRLETTD
jgi:arylsulfatase A-like enzyme